MENELLVGCLSIGRRRLWNDWCACRNSLDRYSWCFPPTPKRRMYDRVLWGGHWVWVRPWSWEWCECCTPIAWRADWWRNSSAWCKESTSSWYFQSSRLLHAHTWSLIPQGCQSIGSHTQSRYSLGQKHHCSKSLSCLTFLKHKESTFKDYSSQYCLQTKS